MTVSVATGCDLLIFNRGESSIVRVQPKVIVGRWSTKVAWSEGTVSAQTYFITAIL